MNRFISSARQRARLGAGCLLAIICSTSSQAAEQVWTAPQAVVFAIVNSPDSKIAQQRLKQAAAELEKSKATALPRVDLSATYSQTDNPMQAFGNILNQGTFDDTIDFNNPGTTDNVGFSAELKYRLYNGGRDVASIEMAESLLDSSSISKTETEHLLGYQVVSAYLMIFQAQEQIRTRQSQLAAIQSSLEVAQARYEAGNLLKAELLNFELERSRAQEYLIISTHQRRLANQIFLHLLGLETGTVNIDTSQALRQQLPEKQQELARPQLKSLEAQLKAAAAEVTRAEKKRYPTLDGFARYQLDYSLMDDGSGDSWTAGIKLNYSLYNGNEHGADLLIKQAAYGKLRESYEKTRLELSLELEKAWLNHSQAKQRRKVTQKMVELARESAQLSRERFKEGVILAADLIAIEMRLTEALVRQSSANANYQIAIAKLRYTSGLQQFSVTTEALLEHHR